MGGSPERLQLRDGVGQVFARRLEVATGVSFPLARVCWALTSGRRCQLREGLNSDVITNTLVQVVETGGLQQPRNGAQTSTAEQKLVAVDKPLKFHNHEHLFLEQTPVGHDVHVRSLRVLGMSAVL